MEGKMGGWMDLMDIISSLCRYPSVHTNGGNRMPGTVRRAIQCSPLTVQRIGPFVDYFYGDPADSCAYGLC